MELQVRRFAANDRECAAKVIDGEAVIINLINGSYYSLDNAGSTMWELLSSGHTVARVVDEIVGQYEVEHSAALSDTQRLIDELIGEKLLVELEAGNMEESGSTKESRTSKTPYTAPTLTIYSDMANLLALDPPMPRLEDIAWTDTPSASPANG